MNKCRWVVASIVVAVVTTLLEFAFHGILLKDAYQATAAIWRPQAEMMRLMPLGWLTTLFISFILVYIYHRGYEGRGKPVVEGVRFGFWIGLFMGVPASVWTYIMVPMPANLALSWFFISMVDFLVAGLIIGLIYRPKVVI